ncbi:MAG: MoaD/ThiS family protein [Gemmatimonadaceae bacterium]
MSIVTVQLFASYAERFGGATIEVPLAPGDTVEHLVNSIRSRPEAGLLPSSLRVAVNRRFASQDQVLRPTDEVALIPPVAGG